MYPETTSLYAATVVDNTTYCKGDDDIVVVEFDGDEEDGIMPQRHVPAMLVTLIPCEMGGDGPIPAPGSTKKRKAEEMAWMSSNATMVSNTTETSAASKLRKI
jgi:hypothetical protein